MSDRVERKLRDVVLARYEYRHEAEFAAGFLDDAGIPFRLQVDDAAMGMTIATPATLWVRGMDVRDALEVLQLPERPEHSAAHQAAEAVRAAPLERGGAGLDGPPAVDRAPIAGPRPRLGGAVPPRAPGRVEVLGAERPGVAGLTRLQRTLGLGILVVASATALVARPGPIWSVVLVIPTLPLGIAGLVGRAPAPVRGFLRAISGSAP